MALSLSSEAFSDHKDIPQTFSCDGMDISPPLTWSDIPPGTKSLALVVEDPDAPDPAAPQRVWVHWVLYNIPPDVQGLPQGTHRDEFPEGTLEGTNDWGNAGYGGPCPPIGRHRYFHKLYALDTVLTGLDKPTKAQLEAAMEGHVLAQTELVGFYHRQ